jgi:phosphoribosylaminoimidazole carboxylase
VQVRIIQDKYAQKVHFAQACVPLSDYADLPDAAAAKAVAQRFGYPLMLKSKRWAAGGGALGSD